MPAKRKPRTKYGVRPSGEARYGNGRLKPPTPNPRVLEQRRALLTGDPNSTQHVDVTQAENALDVALARGWLTEERHRGAQRFAALCRRALGTMPSLRQAKPLSDRVSSPAGMSAEEPAAGKSGVLTPEDHALLARLAKPEITERERTMALRAHRHARVDWSRVSSADLTAIFDAALMTGPYTDPQGDADEVADTALLRSLWQATTAEQARELFDVCVLRSWPRWITLRAFGRPVIGVDLRKQRAFEAGIDRVADYLGVQVERPRGSVRNWRDEEHHADISARRDVPARPGPKREEVFSYIDSAGAPLYEVVRRRRVT